MPNLLKKEKSPYLKQHEDNPVDWYAWNKETLLRAKEENRLPQHLSDQTGLHIFFWTCWIWLLILMKISGVT